MKRKNYFCVISKKTFGECGVHDVQSNSAWTENPYGAEYAVVPDDMVPDIVATSGFCDVVLNDKGTEVVSFTAREIPEIPEYEEPVSAAEQLRADIDYLSVMVGVDL